MVSEQVVGLDHPWSVAFLPDGGLLVTEPAALGNPLKNVQKAAPTTGAPLAGGAPRTGLMAKNIARLDDAQRTALRQKVADTFKNIEQL